MEYTSVKILPETDLGADQSVLIVYTGGTMGMSYDDQGTLTPFNFEGILNEMPALRSMEIQLTIISFKAPIDSSNVTIDHWNAIAEIIEQNYHNHCGFVVLHGTDTLAYSASALSFMLEGLQKPVIFTGSQLPLGAVRSDASQNLITALQIASSGGTDGPLVREVCVYFDYFLFRGNRCKKVESVHFDAFESENYPPLAEVGISIDYNQQMLQPESNIEQLQVHKFQSTNIALLKLFPGMNQSLVEQVFGTEGLQGVILETFGSGNAPTADWFIGIIRKAIQKGVVIFNVSQCNGGRVMQGRYATSVHLLESGVLSGGDITTEAALAKMQFLFSIGEKIDKIKTALVTSIRGEMGH